MLFLSAPAILTTLMITRTFAGETWLLAVNEVIWFGGMMAAGALIAIASRRLGSTIRLVLIGSIVAGITTAAFALAGGSVVLFLALGLINGMTFTFVVTPSTTFFQESAEPSMLGRVLGVVGLFQSLAMPISMLVFGPLADRIPVESVFAIGGISLLVSLGAIFAIPAARKSILTAASSVPSVTTVEIDESHPLSGTIKAVAPVNLAA
jgi:DHA3 family macrolide efflux protein-like MFS transporter